MTNIFVNSVFGVNAKFIKFSDFYFEIKAYALQ